MRVIFDYKINTRLDTSVCLLFMYVQMIKKQLKNMEERGLEVAVEKAECTLQDIIFEEGCGLTLGRLQRFEIENMKNVTSQWIGTILARKNMLNGILWNQTKTKENYF